MAFPQGWPPAPQSSLASLRVFKEGTTTDDFADSAYLFIDITGANPFEPTPVVAPGDRTAVTATHGPSGAAPMGVNPSYPTQAPPKPRIHSMGMIIINRGSKDILFSFDGVNVHGRAVAGGDPVEMYGRHEAGISFKSAAMGQASDFTLIAW